ncbi:class I SAM-dependent methyltransferase [Streptomyces broussonetiae]|uniref:Methyltransferase domain-containing protein n=1 Tax=Streptomyces broussonetiae TaxID=2686304 RepID=A0ABV5EKW7_9ACTN
MTSGDDVKACCAATYSSDAVALLLCDYHHPGGTALTRRLADGLGLTPDHRVLDVASGRGTTVLLLADGYGCHGDGVDYAPANTALVRDAAARLGLTERVTFTTGDAEQLPFADGVFDAVLCECALCTFPDKTKAAAEFARVLRPGGRVGITDVTAIPDRLPPELIGLAAHIACVADARPLDEYAALPSAAGLRPLRAEHHDQAMTRMIDHLEARLNLLHLTSAPALTATGIDWKAAPPLLAAAHTAVTDGTLGYALLTAEKPHNP